MKTKHAMLLLILLLLVPAFSYSQAQVFIGAGFGPRPVVNFYVDLSRQYRVPYGDVYELRRMGLADDDIQMVLMLHSRTPYSLRQIASFRVRGASWDQISTWCGVPMERFPVRHFEGYGEGHRDGHGYSDNGFGRHDRGRSDQDGHNDGRGMHHDEGNGRSDHNSRHGG